MAEATLWLQAVVLGLVQGVTEFLPVSSSGHLILIPVLTGWTYLGKAFDVALHFGTLLAIVGYFREEVEQLWSALFKKTRHRRLLVWLLLATLPAGLVGLVLDDYLENTFGGAGSITVFLVSFGLLLGWCDRVGPKRLEIQDLTTASVVLIGCAQILALVPGVSRCGITISAGLLVGLTRAEAARFSFLMALPITLGAFILRLLKLLLAGGVAAPPPPLLLAIAVAAASGWLCIGVLIRYLHRGSYRPFVRYRVALGMVLFFTLVLVR